MTTRVWSVADVPVTDSVAADLLRRYFDDVASSYYGRQATEAEVAAALVEDPSADLAPPTGVFCVGRLDGVPAGCVGLRFGPAGYAELTRMFVTPEAREHGGGAVLLAAAEQRAMVADAHTVRLETRLDLMAARRLYTAHGYRPIPAYSTGPYAECWYAKDLAPRPAGEVGVADDGARLKSSRVKENTGMELRKPDIDPVPGPPPTDLVITDLTVGDGDEAKPGQVVTVHYVGVSHTNGEEFDASWGRGEPFQFPLGGGRVIAGWDQGVAGMRVGGRRQLVIPPHLAYGDRGAGGVIAPGATLVFVVDLLGVK